MKLGLRLKELNLILKTLDLKLKNVDLKKVIEIVFGSIFQTYFLLLN